MAVKDKFDQFMKLDVTMSAANTLTFARVGIGANIFDYAAFVISRIEYVPNTATIGELVANADAFAVALTGSNSISDLSEEQPEVYDRAYWRVAVSGTPASFQVLELPLIHEFTAMKGGGLIVPAQDMYLAANSTGFSAAGVVIARVYYTIMKLNAGDFLELVQRLRVLST